MTCYFLFCFVTLSAQSLESERLQAEISQLTRQKEFSKKDTVYINRLNALADAVRYYKADSLLLLSKQAIAYSMTAEYAEGETMGLLNLGTYHSDKGDTKHGIIHFKKALDLARSIEDPNLIVESLDLLSGEYAYKGDYANALNGYLEAIELAVKTENLKMVSILNENIATLYISQKDYEQALEYYKKVKRADEAIGDEVLIAKTASNMASLYAEMGKLDYAMFNANSSITIFEKHRLMDWIAYAYEVKGKIYLKEKKYEWALFWYDQSEMIHKKIEDQRGEIDLLHGMAEAYLGLEKDSVSQQYATKAYALSETLHSNQGVGLLLKGFVIPQGIFVITPSLAYLV